MEPNGVLDLSLASIGNIDYENNKSLAVFAIKSGKDAVKRGLMAVNMATGYIEWEFIFGPQVRNVIIEDIDLDGKQEIAVGTYAPDNGAEWNGISDDSSYVFLLNYDGSLRWKRAVGGFFTGGHIDVGDMTGDGKPEIITYCFSLRQIDKAQDEIMLLDRTNGSILKQKGIGEWLTAWADINLRLLHDLDMDGKAELILGTSSGLVCTLDDELGSTDFFRGKAGSVEVVGAADLDGNGALEVICITGDLRLHILNSELKPVFDRQLARGSSVHLVKGEKRTYILNRMPELLSHEKYHRFTLYEFAAKPLAALLTRREQPYVLWSFLALLCIGVLAYSGNLFYGSYGRRMLLLFLEKAGVLNKVLLLRQNGRVERIGAQWGELLDVQSRLKNGLNFANLFNSYIPEQLALQTALAEIIKDKKRSQSRQVTLAEEPNKKVVQLDSFYLPLQKLIFIQMTDLIEQAYLQQIKSWAPVAQRMAHGIKNPLTAVKLNTEELRHLLKTNGNSTNGEMDEYFEAIISQVNRLTRVSDRFMRFVSLEPPQAKPIDLNILTPELISQWLPEHQRDIHVEFQLEQELPKALFDREQFEFALKTVFFNALESLIKKGRILVSTSLTQVFFHKGRSAGTSFVELQIRDTGCGIPSEILHKIGEPYITNKESGTGLGLSIVFKNMREHGGDFIIDSQESLGTVVTLRFKMAK